MATIITRAKRKRGLQSPQSESSIIKSATSKVLDYLHATSKSTISEPIPSEIERITAYYDEDDLKDPFYIEQGKFKRSARLIWKSIKIVGAFDQNLLDTIQERVDQTNEIDPDESQFEDLDNTMPWNEDDLVSKGPNLTSEIIKSIKKGMLNGTMYNLGIDSLKIIFNSLTVTDWISIHEKSFIRIVRCPFCPVEFSLAKIYHHIERFHTGSLVCCIDCGKLLATESASSEHLVGCKPAQSAKQIYKFEQSANHGSSVITSDIQRDVKWVVNWRPRIDSFLESIKIYETSDYISCTDSSESEEE
uniref:C2H2-type domain-containing protein n=1 Tax=Tetranychus urticae TaxID=32264 RepID=T1KUH9_TETUR